MSHHNTALNTFNTFYKIVTEKLNFYHSLSLFSRRHIDVIFLFFLEQDLTFHAICLHGDNLHEMSNSVF